MAYTEPTVFIVDDHPGVRGALAALVESEGFCAEEFASAKEFLAAFDAERPGCLVSDVQMPEMSGLELQKQLKRQGVDLPIVFVTGHGNVPVTVQAFQAGAVTVMEKPFEEDELIGAVRQAIQKDAETRRRRRKVDAIRARLDSLTDREGDVLDLVVAGKANKVVASILEVSEKNIEYHRANIMRKMQAGNLAELIHMVRDAGSPMPEPCNRDRRQALVVEDTWVIRKCEVRMLEQIGFAVAEAENGREALSLLREIPPPELALVDWNMPQMNGLEFVKAVRGDNKYASMFVMMVTMESEMDNIVQALDAGANEYLMKPVSEEALLEKLQIMGFSQ